MLGYVIVVAFYTFLDFFFKLEDSTLPALNHICIDAKTVDTITRRVPVGADNNSRREFMDNGAKSRFLWKSLSAN